MNALETLRNQIRSATANMVKAQSTSLALFQSCYTDGATDALLGGFEDAIRDAHEVERKPLVKLIRASIARIVNVDSVLGATVTSPARLTIVEVSKSGDTAKYSVLRVGTQYALCVKLQADKVDWTQKLRKFMEAYGKDQNVDPDDADSFAKHLRIYADSLTQPTDGE